MLASTWCHRYPWVRWRQLRLGWLVLTSCGEELSGLAIILLNATPQTMRNLMCSVGMKGFVESNFSTWSWYHMAALMCLITQSVLTTLSGKIEVRTVLWARLWSWNNFRHMPKLNCENSLGWGVSPEASIDVAKTGTDWLKPREELGSDATVTQDLGSAVSQEGDTRSLGHPSPLF